MRPPPPDVVDPRAAQEPRRRGGRAASTDRMGSQGPIEPVDAPRLGIRHRGAPSSDLGGIGSRRAAGRRTLKVGTLDDPGPRGEDRPPMASPTANVFASLTGRTGSPRRAAPVTGRPPS